MLWRQSYVTRILRDVECPVVQMVNLDGSNVFPDTWVWVGGFDFQSLADQGVWWRLFQSDFPNDQRVKKVFVMNQVTTQEISLADSLVPMSETGRCLLAEDPNGFWRQLVQPDIESRGFAALFQGGKIQLLMVGPPTEEAWEEFSSAWQTRT